MRLFLRSIFLFYVFCSALQVEPVMAVPIFDTIKSFFGGEKNDHVIFEAVKKDDVKRVSRIVFNNPNLVNSRTQYGRTPLHYVRTVKMARLLLDHDADVNAQSKTEEVPLHYARTAEMVQLLLDHGADVHARDQYGRTPLHYENSVEEAQILLDHGADINAQDKEGQTLLYTVRTAEVARMLLDHGLDVHAKDKEGRTPLHTAYTAEVVQLLLAHGADVHARDQYGGTPLHYARTAEVARMLLDHGLDVHAKNKRGKTPLHTTDTTEVARMLLDRGADIHAKDKMEWTPLQQALERIYFFYNHEESRAYRSPFVFKQLRLAAILMKNGATLSRVEKPTVFLSSSQQIIKIFYFIYQVSQRGNDGLSFNDLEIIRKWARDELRNLDLYLNDIKKDLKAAKRPEINSNPSKLLKALDARIAEERRKGSGGGNGGGGNCSKSFE